MRSGGKSECGNVQSTAASHSVSESVPGPPPLPLTAPSVSTSAAAAADTSAALPPATAEPPQHFPHAGSSSLTTVNPHKAGEELLPLADRVLAVLDAVNTADDAMVDGAASGGVVSLVSRAPLHALMALFLDDRIPLRALTSALLPRRFYSGAKHSHRLRQDTASCAKVWRRMAAMVPHMQLPVKLRIMQAIRTRKFDDMLVDTMQALLLSCKGHELTLMKNCCDMARPDGGLVSIVYDVLQAQLNILNHLQNIATYPHTPAPHDWRYPDPKTEPDSTSTQAAPSATPQLPSPPSGTLQLLPPPSGLPEPGAIAAAVSPAVAENVVPSAPQDVVATGTATAAVLAAVEAGPVQAAVVEAAAAGMAAAVTSNPLAAAAGVAAATPSEPPSAVTSPDAASRGADTGFGTGTDFGSAVRVASSLSLPADSKSAPGGPSVAPAPSSARRRQRVASPASAVDPTDSASVSSRVSGGSAAGSGFGSTPRSLPWDAPAPALSPASVDSAHHRRLSTGSTPLSPATVAKKERLRDRIRQMADALLASEQESAPEAPLQRTRSTGSVARGLSTRPSRPGRRRASRRTSSAEVPDGPESAKRDGGAGGVAESGAAVKNDAEVHGQGEARGAAGAAGAAGAGAADAGAGVDAAGVDAGAEVDAAAGVNPTAAPVPTPHAFAGVGADGHVLHQDGLAAVRRFHSQSNVVSARSARPPARLGMALRPRRRLRKVLCDIDDTMYANYHDVSFRSGVPYPGMRAFLTALRVGRTDMRQPEGQLVVVTARPSVARGVTHASLTEKGFAPLTILSGSFPNLLSHSLMAEKKLANIERFLSLYPEADMVWVGDSGQGDVAVGMALIQQARALRKPPPPVFIHDVVPSKALQRPKTPTEERQRLKREGILVFDSYVEAAMLAQQLGLITPQQAHRVADAAVAEIDACLFAPTDAEAAAEADTGAAAAGAGAAAGAASGDGTPATLAAAMEKRPSLRNRVVSWYRSAVGSGASSPTPWKADTRPAARRAELEDALAALRASVPL